MLFGVDFVVRSKRKAPRKLNLRGEVLHPISLWLRKGATAI